MENNFAAFSKEYSNGALIFAEFEKGDKFYLIQAGRVEIVKQFGNEQKTLDILGESDMFGEMALLEDSARTATAIAVGEVRLLEFNKSNFQSLILETPQIAVRLLKMFTKRIYDAKRRFLTLMLDDPNARVADVILMLNEINSGEMDSKELKTSVTIKTTPDYIARWAGMSMHDTNKTLYFFNKQGYLELFADRILVKNLNYYHRLVNTARAKSK